MGTASGAPVPIGGIADDLSGALALGGRLSAQGWRVRVVGQDGLREVGSDELPIVDAAARERTPEESIALVTRVARALADRGCRIMCLKVDSHLRGPVAEMIEGVASGCDARAAVLSIRPQRAASIETRGAISAARHDPGVLTDLFDEASWETTILRKPEQLLAHDDRAKERRRRAGVVVDAANRTQEYLVARRALERGVTMFVGSLDFLEAVGAGAGDAVGGAPALGFVGSFHPATGRQVRFYLRLSGAGRVELTGEQSTSPTEIRAVVRDCLRRLRERRDVIIQAQAPSRVGLGSRQGPGCLSEIAAELVPQIRGEVAGLWATGGTTAQAVIGDGLRATGIEGVRELMPGVAAGRLFGGHTPGLSVVTKPGAWGPPHAIAWIAACLRISGREDAVGPEG